MVWLNVWQLWRKRMASIKGRVTRLERKARSLKPVFPYVVYLAEGETAEEARARVLDGSVPPDDWVYVLCPMPLSEEDWISKYSP
jgi:hypothetical protein